MIYELKSDRLTVKIDSRGAQLKSATLSGKEYMWCGDEKYWEDVAPVLFPICGRLIGAEYGYGGKKYQMGIHGFAQTSEFTPTRVEKNRLTLSISSNEQTKKVYPFDFDFEADFTVSDTTLELKLTVKNTGEDVLPYMVGWHPGFALMGDGEINNFSVDFGGVDKVLWHVHNGNGFLDHAPLDYALKDGKYQLNEKEIYSNDTMVFRQTHGRAYLSSPDTDSALEIRYSENLPYFCIWKECFSEARFICLEPWSDIPSDGSMPEEFESREMSRLSPGASEEYSYSVKFI